MNEENKNEPNRVVLDKIGDQATDDYLKWVKEKRGDNHGVNQEEIDKEIEEEEGMDDDEFEARYVEQKDSPKKD